MNLYHNIVAACCVFLFVGVTSAQSLPIANSPAVDVSSPPRVHSTYVLGPDDQIAIRAIDAEEISDKPVRIDMSGNLRLPLIGRLRASGLTAEQLEGAIAERLKTYIQKPDVSVVVVEFRSQPVSVIGSVKNPGVHQLQGRKTLIEMLSLAGGLNTDAGHSVRISRRNEWGPIPLANAAADPTGAFTVAQVNLKSLMEAKNPAENIVICPHDVVSVPRAEMVYVTGQVQRSGGFVLNERETLSVLQALSLAGGLDRAASPQNSRVMRVSADSPQRVEIAVDLKKIMMGRASDVLMKPDDILFVPSSAPKKAALRAVEAAVQVGTGLVIWRR